MTNQTDIDALLTEARTLWSGSSPEDLSVVAHSLADALESTAAELRQARRHQSLTPGYVWQDYYSPNDVAKIVDPLQDELARAQDVITTIRIEHGNYSIPRDEVLSIIGSILDSYDERGQREQAWDAPRALDLDRASAALRALIDHAEQVERERDEACAQMTAVIRRALEAALGGES